MHKRWLLVAVFAVGALAGCNQYGKELKFNGGQLFYTSAVTADEANALGNYLTKEKFFDGTPKSVQLTRAGSTYQFRMVIKKGIDQDPNYHTIFQQLCTELSDNVFNKAPLEVHLCDDNLKTIKIVTPPAKT